MGKVGSNSKQRLLAPFWVGQTCATRQTGKGLALVNRQRFCSGVAHAGSIAPSAMLFNLWRDKIFATPQISCVIPRSDSPRHNLQALLF